MTQQVLNRTKTFTVLYDKIKMYLTKNSLALLKLRNVNKTTVFEAPWASKTDFSLFGHINLQYTHTCLYRIYILESLCFFKRQTKYKSHSIHEQQRQL